VFSYFVNPHEIALKKGNRGYFTRQLVVNIKIALQNKCVVKQVSGSFLLEFSENSGLSREAVEEKLAAIPGIANFLPVIETVPDVSVLGEKILREIRNLDFSSFRVSARRSDKNFNLTSVEINETVGRFLKTETEKRVDLDNAELEIFVEILRDRFFFSTRKIKGIGGLPVGTGGKAVSLFSGGIDSPVASFMLIKRGCSLIFAHFHSFPYADSSSKDKAVELVRNLNIYQNNSRLYLLPFGDAQKQIVLIVPEEYRVLIYRRLMMKVSSLIAEKEGAGALVTGESLGQVASQTLKNMAVVSVAADRLILRPLVGMDKEEIIEIAKKIKTYEISILPDQDCCQLFTPKHPATGARLEDVLEIETGLEIGKMASEILDGAEIVDI